MIGLMSNRSLARERSSRGALVRLEMVPFTAKSMPSGLERLLPDGLQRDRALIETQQGRDQVAKIYRLLRLGLRFFLFLFRRLSLLLRHVGKVKRSVGLLDQVYNRLLENEFLHLELSFKKRTELEAQAHLLGAEKGIFGECGIIGDLQRREADRGRRHDSQADLADVHLALQGLLHQREVAALVRAEINERRDQKNRPDQ